MSFDPAMLPLRDIELPPAPAAWPPAISSGWLAVGTALALLLAWGCWRYFRRQRAGRAALAEFETLLARRAATPADTRWLAELSVLLRREALARYPREAVAGLEGEAWLEFLVRSGAGDALRQRPGRWLLHGPYQRRPEVPPADAEALLQAVREWLAR